MVRARYRIALIAIFVVVCGFADTSSAHPISVVVETALVDKDRITLDVEVFAEDLYFYHDLQPNDKNEVPASSLRTRLRNMVRYCLSDCRFLMQGVIDLRWKGGRRRRG